MPDQISVKNDSTTLLHKILTVYTLRLVQISWTFAMPCNYTIPQIILVIHLVMWQKDGLTWANINCSHGYSLGEITAIILCYADEEVFYLIFFLILPNSIPTGYPYYHLIRNRGISNGIPLYPQKNNAELQGWNCLISPTGSMNFIWLTSLV